MAEGARFRDGANEISGSVITYDVRGHKISADSGADGSVKILIDAPSTENDAS
jgi:lipopolysaccharide export system protein LptA